MVIPMGIILGGSGIPTISVGIPQKKVRISMELETKMAEAPANCFPLKFHGIPRNSDFLLGICRNSWRRVKTSEKDSGDQVESGSQKEYGHKAESRHKADEDCEMGYQSESSLTPGDYSKSKKVELLRCKHACKNQGLGHDEIETAEEEADDEKITEEKVEQEWCQMKNKKGLKKPSGTHHGNEMGEDKCHEPSP